MTLDELQGLPWADTLCEAAAPQAFLAWLDVVFDAMPQTYERRFADIYVTLPGRIKAIEIKGTISV